MRSFFFIILGSLALFAACTPDGPLGEITTLVPKGSGNGIGYTVLEYFRLDHSFSGGGIVHTPILDSARLDSVLVDTAEDFFGTGTADNGQEPYFAATKYHANGSLDTSFGNGDGKAIYDVSDEWDTARGAALQTDGKVVMVGFGGKFITQWEAIRFLPNGGLDSGFATGGKLILEETSGGSARTVIIRSDGKLLLLGTGTEPNQGTDTTAVLAIQRAPDGSPDVSFGSNGKAVFFQGNHPFVESALLQVVGGVEKIILVGGTDDKSLLLRINGNGTSDGPALVGSPGTSFAGAAIQPDGKIVVTGAALLNGVTRGIVERYDGSTLALDTSFGVGGRVVLELGGDAAVAVGVVSQSDGIVVSGTRTLSSGTQPVRELVITKLGFDGSVLISTFSQGVGSSPVVTSLVAHNAGMLAAGKADNQFMFVRVIEAQE